MKISDLIPGNRKNNENNDLGFGTKITGSGERLINRDGSFNVVRTGFSTFSPYQWLVEMSWAKFLGIVALFVVLINIFFAILFCLCGPDSLLGVDPVSGSDLFLQAFFFSVQSFTTVGYGTIGPNGITANIIASVDALVGLMAFALATGLFFARFSRPRAQIMFSEKAIITPYQDRSSLQFRIVNTRNNKIINLRAVVTMTWIEMVDGERKRRFAPLELERDTVTLFPLNWTVVHPIGPESPLRNMIHSDLTKTQTEILVLIEGFDETFAQTVHINGSYTCKEINFDVKFAPMYRSEKDYVLLELDKIDAVLPLAAEEEE